jgi:lipopolysaccharide transport system ATP-binding protein
MFMPSIQRLTGQNQGQYHREFWALNDVNFEVGKGQTVGIIGQNGSGKSTLLQIITGTMAPTLGEVKTRGRTAALLELGSGFNPDFTGRENVYLNGSLLGLTYAQIDEKFDYIAAFAEIGDHLDQPVKTYSSGMMLRLAFAVQVAVETEVLIIDEALAVGDARFQMKCFKRLEELKARGTTILFVSHATELVRSFCDFGLVLDKGKTIFWGDAKTATVKYLASLFPDQTQPKKVLETSDTSDLIQAVANNIEGCLTIHPDQTGIHTFGVGGATLDWLKVYGLEPPNMIVGGRDIRIRCQFSWDIDFVRGLIDSGGYQNNITLGVTIADKRGTYLFGCNGFDCQLPIDSRQNGRSVVEFELAMPYLLEGNYFLAVAIALGDLKNHVQLKWYDSALQIRYIEADKKVFGLLGVEYKMSLIE